MSEQILVEPSNNLFKELGNNSYEYNELLAEFIDNSIAAKYEDKIVTIEIEIGYSQNSESVEYVIVKDNAQGMDLEILPDAISPAKLSGGYDLNEHGLGMKQAVASLGELEYLKTKTEDIDYEIMLDEFKYGEIEVKKNNAKYRSGTEIKIINFKPLVPFRPQNYTQNVVPTLGAKYRRYLRPQNLKANIEIILKNIDKNKKGELKNPVPNKWTIQEVKPTYFHPNERNNKPAVNKKEFKGRGWKAKLTFGYAPTKEEYEDMGLEKPKNYHPYAVSINKEGLDVIRNNRVIELHQLVEIGLVKTRHNKYNNIKGEIDLIKGFSTAITKNSVMQDRNYLELLDQIKEYLTKNKYLETKTYSGELPENLLRDRLKKHFETTTVPRMRKTEVESEYPVGGLGGFIDLFADEEAWEIKNNQATGLDVYQLFAYLDMGDIEKGYLVAQSFSTGAKEASKFIENKHNKDIDLVEITDFPINSAPSIDEIDRYY